MDRRLLSLHEKARALKRETLALHIAVRDPRTPRLARIVAMVVVAYAFSPIDLIPDFIPVLGLLDDLILVPLGIALCLRLIPPVVLADARRAAEARMERPRSFVAAAAILMVWIAASVTAAWLLYEWFVRA